MSKRKASETSTPTAIGSADARARPRKCRRVATRFGRVLRPVRRVRIPPSAPSAVGSTTRASTPRPSPATHGKTKAAAAAASAAASDDDNNVIPLSTHQEDCASVAHPDGKQQQEALALLISMLGGGASANSEPSGDEKEQGSTDDDDDNQSDNDSSVHDRKTDVRPARKRRRLQGGDTNASVDKSRAGPTGALLNKLGAGSVFGAGLGAGLRGSLGGVAKVFCVLNRPSQRTPWQREGQVEVQGSACLLEGRMVLTNTHVVDHARSVRLLKHGSSKRYAARIVAIGRVYDLALLEITADVEEFWKDVTPLKMGGLPELNANVIALGYPTLLDSVSISRGVVSRILVQACDTDSYRLLSIQTTAPINPGNSGGPLLLNGRLVGVARAVLTDSENIGYAIPAEVVQHFLKQLADARVSGPDIAFAGVCSLGIDTEDCLNQSKRAYYGLAPNEDGCIVSRVVPLSDAARILRPGDVLLRIDGHAVASDGTVRLRASGERVPFSHAITRRSAGDIVEVEYKREGMARSARVRFSGRPVSFRREVAPSDPAYVVWAGLVFVRCTMAYLSSCFSDENGGSGGGGGRGGDMSSDLCTTWSSREKYSEDEEIIVLDQVLAADPLTFGYTDLRHLVLGRVNGRTVRSLADLDRLLRHLKPTKLKPAATFELGGPSEPVTLVLDIAAARAAHDRILADNNIPLPGTLLHPATPPPPPHPPHPPGPHSTPVRPPARDLVPMTVEAKHPRPNAKRYALPATPTTPSATPAPRSGQPPIPPASADAKHCPPSGPTANRFPPTESPPSAPAARASGTMTLADSLWNRAIVAVAAPSSRTAVVAAPAAPSSGIAAAAASTSSPTFVADKKSRPAAARDATTATGVDDQIGMLAARGVSHASVRARCRPIAKAWSAAGRLWTRGRAMMASVAARAHPPMAPVAPAAVRSPPARSTPAAASTVPIRANTSPEASTVPVPVPIPPTLMAPSASLHTAVLTGSTTITSGRETAAILGDNSRKVVEKTASAPAPTVSQSRSVPEETGRSFTSKRSEIRVPPVSTMQTMSGTLVESRRIPAEVRTPSAVPGKPPTVAAAAAAAAAQVGAEPAESGQAPVLEPSANGQSSAWHYNRNSTLHRESLGVTIALNCSGQPRRTFGINQVATTPMNADFDEK
jgi:S1-C subfamily serine protease